MALFFPDLTTDLKPDSLTFLPQEVFADVTSGERKIADLVVQAQLSSQSSLFIIHLEHQSSTKADFNKRMFHYFARLHEKYALPVYPIVLFSFDVPQRPELDCYRVQLRKQGLKKSLLGLNQLEQRELWKLLQAGWNKDCNKDCNKEGRREN